MNDCLSTFPYRRMRRGRRYDFSRLLLAEHHLSLNDLIYPVFIMEGHCRREELASMPGIFRMSMDLLLKEAEQVAQWLNENNQK